jgi:hypothetical protein
VPEEQRSAFGVFRREQQPGDRPPGSPTEAAAKLSDLRPGENLELARRLPTPLGMGPAYIWPAAKEVCFAVGPSAGCDAVKRVIRTGVSVSTSTGPNIGAGLVRVAGIVRDGIRAMRIDLANGDSVSVPVNENFFVTDVKVDPLAVRWNNGTAAGKVRLGR